MKTFLLSTYCAAALSATALAGAFTPGDIVVDTVGTGASALTSAATAVSLNEYSPSGGSLVESIALPTAASGVNNPYTQSGTASSEGELTLSPNGQYLTLFGYDATPGTTGVASTASTSVPRTVAIVNSAGQVDTSTALTDAASGNNARVAITTNGTQIWVAGGASGVRYTTAGSTTSTALTSDSNFYDLQVANGQLYALSQQSAYQGVLSIGTGIPTTGGQTITALPGLSLSNASNAYSFFFADVNSSTPNVLYVADSKTSTAIQKFSLVSGQWTANGDISITGNVTGVTGEVVGNSVDLFVTNPTTLYSLTDTSGYDSTINGSATAIETAPTNEDFLGVSFAPVPEPSTWAAVLLGLATLFLFRSPLRRKSRALILLAGCGLLAGASSASAQLFTPGDLIVSTYGNLTNTALYDGEETPITLQEYSVSGASSASLVLDDPLPVSASGSNVGIVGEYGSSSEGTIQLSGNGQYLTIGGYDAAAAASFNTNTNTGGVALAQSSDTTVPRVAALIDANGNVNTSTTFSGPYNTNNPRSVYSPNGSTLYLSGQGSGSSDEGGLYVTSLGSTATPAPVFTSESTRTVQEYGGNLYYSADQNSKKGDLTGIFEYSGTTSASVTNPGVRLTGSSTVISGTTVNLSPEGFAFATGTTMYVADTGDPKGGTVGDGGIQKWSYYNSAWNLDYTLTDSNFLSPSLANTSGSGETGFEALTLQVTGNTVDIYAVSYTAGDADPNGLYAIADTLSDLTLPTGANAETFTELESAPGLSGSGGADYNFKGVSFSPVPEPGSWAMAACGLGALAGFQRFRKQRRRQLSE